MAKLKLKLDRAAVPFAADAADDDADDDAVEKGSCRESEIESETQTKRERRSTNVKSCYVMYAFSPEHA